MQNINFIWNPDVFKVLGIRFSTNINEIVPLNYEYKLAEIKKILLSWSKRQLTPLGKVTVIKSLAVSKIVHLLINLPDPSNQFLNELKSCFYTFLWNNKKGKIKQSAVCASYEQGGFKMLDMASFLSAMKIRCLNSILTSDSLCKRVLTCICPEILKLEHYGSEYANIIMSKCQNKFWSDVAKHYKKLYNMCAPESSEEFLSECIHYNVNIVRGNKTMHVKEWINNDILRIGDLVNADGKFYSYIDFVNRYHGISTNFLMYAGTIEALKDFKLKCGVEVVDNKMLERPKTWNVIKGSNGKDIYETLTDSRNPPISVQKWRQAFSDESLDWKNIFLKPYKLTTDSKLRWFQVRILHRLIPTQRYLYIRKLVESPLCILCNEEEDSIQHLFWACHVSQNFWTELISWLSEKCPTCRTLALSELFIIFGIKPNQTSDKVLDLIILLAKFHIYKCKLQNTLPNILYLKNIIKNRYKIEKYNNTISGNQAEFEEAWHPYNALIEE